MVDVFISYKRDDRSRADRISKKLHALGLDVWLDARIQSGTAFDTQIESALATAKAVLVLWTPDSVNSEWVRNEASVGRDRGSLVALMLTPCELPIAFRSTQYEPLFGSAFPDDDPSWIKVVERIKDLVGRREQVDSKQRKILRRRKMWRVLSWLAVWPLGAALLAMAVAYALAPLQQVRPGVYQFSGEQWDDGFVYALGSVEIEGEHLPVNHVEIACRRYAGDCVESRAELREGELSISTDRRQIVRWDDTVIVSRSQSPCADVIMTIDRGLETVNTVRIRKPLTPPNDSLCSWMNERNSYRLIDGSARAYAVENERAPYYMAALIAVLLAWTAFVIARIVRALRSR